VPDIPERALLAAERAIANEMLTGRATRPEALARAALEAAAPVLAEVIAQSLRGEIVESLRRAASGRREYAAGGGQEEATALLLRCAECYESAARIIEDPRHLMSVIPSWRWTEEESASLHQREGTQ
jgi:hypothetical protein